MKAILKSVWQIQEGQRWLNGLESADETEFEINDHGVRGRKGGKQSQRTEQTWNWETVNCGFH